jgi:hypothetical protein
MKNFLAIYLGSQNSRQQTEWQSLDEATRQKRIGEGMKAWGDWMTKHKDVVVVEGGPLGKTKRTSHAGVADVKNEMAGFIVIRAESHDAAAKLFLNHPHFSIFPGESVEIMEVMPIPTQ